MNIPFSQPSLGPEEEAALSRVVRSGWLAAGPETAAFEEEFSNYISPPGEHYSCIFTNSCTSALKMAYKWVKEQEIVRESGFIEEEYMFYPRNTFCATYSAAIEMGVAVRPYDSDEDMTANFWGTGNESLNAAMHRVNMAYGGVKDETPCLIEDSAHRIEPNDPLVGQIRCYSFYATKNMTTGSGGMFVTNNPEIYERARLFWRDGLTTSTYERGRGAVGYQVRAMAGGYDGNDLAAALGRVQLRRLPEFTRRRNEIRDRYNAGLGQQWAGNHLYPYFVGSTEEVGPTIGRLKVAGVAAAYHYPGTGWRGVSLPIFPDLTNAQVDYVIQTVKKGADGPHNL